jgi:phosphatidylserine decarboxylase
LSFVLLGWKWRIDIKQAIVVAFVIGGLAGFIVYIINSKVTDLSIAFIVFLELSFVFMMTFVVIVLRFYRDPERVPPETDRVILSPADGHVNYVKRVEKGTLPVSTKHGRQFELNELTGTDLFLDATYLVGIEMNMLNVHVNRSPVKGKIILQKRIKGRFLSLRRPESESLNERVTTIIDNGAFKVAVIQIATRLVRRIVSYLKQGDTVEIGQRIGMIKFGSQVDMTIPELQQLEIVVKPGDAVKAGLTVIAKY